MLTSASSVTASCVAARARVSVALLVLEEEEGGRRLLKGYDDAVGGMWVYVFFLVSLLERDGRRLLKGWNTGGGRRVRCRK